MYYVCACVCGVLEGENMSENEREVCSPHFESGLLQDLLLSQSTLSEVIYNNGNDKVAY